MVLTNLKDELVNLSKVNHSRVYLELVFCGIISTSTYFLLLYNQTVINFLICLIFSYRGLAFLHEVSHLNKRLPFIQIVYNLSFGFINLLPAYSMNNHKHHHSISSFGTTKDPEYKEWTKMSKLVLLRPIFLGILHPFILILRFGVLPIIFPLISMKYKKVIFVKASTFVVNSKYLRPFNDKEFRTMRKEDFFCSIALLIRVVILLYINKFFLGFTFWILTTIFISIANAYRALVAHRYVYNISSQSDKKTAQLKDSVTIEGGLFTELWAPLNLRYHSTHHLLPNVPYYSLKKAHQLLKNNLPINDPYHKTIESSFVNAFIKLFRSFQSDG